AATVSVSCASNAIRGEWHHEDGQSRTMLKIEEDHDCFIFVGGPVDGMASECKWRRVGGSSYEFWFLDEHGNTEDGAYISFSYREEDDVLRLVTEERTIELRRK